MGKNEPYSGVGPMFGSDPYGESMASSPYGDERAAEAYYGSQDGHVEDEDDKTDLETVADTRRRVTQEAIAEDVADAEAAAEGADDAHARGLNAPPVEVDGPTAPPPGAEDPQGGVYSGQGGPNGDTGAPGTGRGFVTAVGGRRRYGRVLVFLSNPALTSQIISIQRNRSEMRGEAFRPTTGNESEIQRPSQMQQAPLTSILFGCTDEIVDGFAYVNQLVKQVDQDTLWFQMPTEAVNVEEGAEPVVFESRFAADYTWATVRMAAVDYLTVEEVPPPALPQDGGAESAAGSAGDDGGYLGSALEYREAGRL